MTSHNNIHIPSESFPNWIWYALEFFIVLSISALTANELSKIINNYEITETINNWIFWSTIGSIFILWYIIIRRFVIKRI